MFEQLFHVSYFKDVILERPFIWPIPMISNEGLRSLLQSTYSANSNEELEAATNQLTCFYNDKEFAQLLLNFIIDDYENFQNKQAAIVQLREYFKNNLDILESDGYSLFIQLTSHLPIELQRTTEILAFQLAFYFINYGKINNIISFVEDSLKSDFPLPGFVLLHCLVSCIYQTDSKINIREFHDSISPMIESEWICTMKMWQDFPNDGITQMMTHYMAVTYYDHLRDTQLSEESFVQWSGFLLQAVQSQIPSLTFDIEKDLFKVIYLALIINHDDPLNININQTLEASILYCSSGKLSCLKYISLIINQIFTTDNLYRMIEDQLETIITALLVNSFSISEEEKEYFYYDPVQFIERVHPQSNEKATARSAASIALLNGSEINPTISEISLSICLSTISDDPWNLYSKFIFLSSSLKYYDGNQENLSQIIQIIDQLLSSQDLILMSAAIALLSSYPIINPHPEKSQEYVLICLSTISQTQGIIQYLSSCAIGHLLSISNADLADNITSQYSDLVLTTAQNMFVLSKEFPTDKMSQSVSNYISYFSKGFASIADQCVTTLFELFTQYANEESVSARQSSEGFCTAISNLLHSLQPENIPSIVDYIIHSVDSVADDYSNYNEELLIMLESCVSVSKDLNESIMFLPELLLKIFENDGRELSVNISHILKIMVTNFDHNNISEITIPLIFQIIDCILIDADGDCLPLDDVETMITLTLIITNYYKDIEQVKEKMSEIIESFGSIDLSYGCDLAAIFIRFDPQVSLQSENLYQSWLQSNPCAFLSAAIAALPVLSQMDQSGEAVSTIHELIKQRVADLSEMELIDSDEQLEFYDIQNLLNYQYID